jgi:hypothetical protein
MSCVAKLNESDGSPAWGTYIHRDQGGLSDIAVNETGDVFMTGYSNAVDFPTSGSGTRPVTGQESILVYLNSPDKLIWSTAYSTNRVDRGLAVDVDPVGNVVFPGLVRELFGVG